MFSSVPRPSPFTRKGITSTPSHRVSPFAKRRRDKRNTTSPDLLFSEKSKTKKLECLLGKPLSQHGQNREHRNRQCLSFRLMVILVHGTAADSFPLPCCGSFNSVLLAAFRLFLVRSGTEGFVAASGAQYKATAGHFPHPAEHS